MNHSGLELRARCPGFLCVNDRTEIVAELINHSRQPMEIELGVRAEGLKTGPCQFRLELAAGQCHSLSLELESRQAGLARLQLVARTDTICEVRNYDLPVHEPTVPWVRLFQSALEESLELNWEQPPQQVHLEVRCPNPVTNHPTEIRGRLRVGTGAQTWLEESFGRWKPPQRWLLPRLQGPLWLDWQRQAGPELLIQLQWEERLPAGQLPEGAFRLKRTVTRRKKEMEAREGVYRVPLGAVIVMHLDLMEPLPDRACAELYLPYPGGFEVLESQATLDNGVAHIRSDRGVTVTLRARHPGRYCLRPAWAFVYNQPHLRSACPGAHFVIEAP